MAATARRSYEQTGSIAQLSFSSPRGTSTNERKWSLKRQSCQVRKGPKLKGQFWTPEPWTSHLPLEAIGNQRRVHGHWAQSGSQKRYPSPKCISNETNDRHCPPFRILACWRRVHLLGEDPPMLCPPKDRSLSYCDDDAQRSHVVETQRLKSSVSSARPAAPTRRTPSAGVARAKTTKAA